MPARGYPIDIDAIILFELTRGSGYGPELWRRARDRMQENGYRLYSGAWYPAMDRLARKGLVSWSKPSGPFRKGTSRIVKDYVLTEKGAREARRLSTILRNLILSPEASA